MPTSDPAELTSEDFAKLADRARERARFYSRNPQATYGQAKSRELLLDLAFGIESLSRQVAVMREALALRELLARSTPGALRIERRDNSGGDFTYIVYGDTADFSACSELATDHAKANAELIVALVNAAPELLDTITRQAEQLERTERIGQALLDAGDALVTGIDALCAEEAGCETWELVTEPADAWRKLRAGDEQSLRPTPPLPELRERDLEIAELPPAQMQGGGGVRITHTPSGESAECAEHRSYIKNKAAALRLLRERLRELGWTPLPEQDEETEP